MYPKPLVDVPPPLSKEDQIYKVQKRVLAIADRQVARAQEGLRYKEVADSAKFCETQKKKLQDMHAEYKILKRRLESIKKTK